MRETPTEARRHAKPGRATLAESARCDRQSRAAGAPNVRWKSPRREPEEARSSHACVVDRGNTTHVLVPVEEYERLMILDMARKAVAQIESGDDDFVDADDLALELAAEKVAAARKAKGLTQKQLGDKLKLPQSQISRIERNPDRTTVRTLKRIARALGVDVSVLVSGI